MDDFGSAGITFALLSTGCRRSSLKTFILNLRQICPNATIVKCSTNFGNRYYTDFNGRTFHVGDCNA